MTDPTTGEATGEATDPARGDPAVHAVPIAAPGPLVPRWIGSLPTGLYAALIIGVFAVLVLVAVLANPGHQVGPVRPARPPVGGAELPPRGP